MLRRFGLLCLAVWGASALSETYPPQVKVILDKHCVECHDGLAHDPDLSQFPFPSEKFTTQIEIVDRILQRLSNQTMPVGIRPKLNLEETNMIQQWRDEGMGR